MSSLPIPEVHAHDAGVTRFHETKHVKDPSLEQRVSDNLYACPRAEPRACPRNYVESAAETKQDYKEPRHKGLRRHSETVSAILCNHAF